MSEGEETIWRTNRSEIYEMLRNSLKNDGLCKSQITQTSDVKKPPQLRPYSHPDDQAVHLICAPIPQNVAKKLRNIAEIIATELVSGSSLSEDKPSHDVYLNEEKNLHCTLFHTSHPLELLKSTPAIRSSEIEALQGICNGFPSIWVSCVELCIASSGAIIMLLETKNADGQESFSVDRFRKALRLQFPNAPKRQTKIIHITLGRILNCDLSSLKLNNAIKKAKELSKLLHEEGLNYFQLPFLWYIKESHEYSACGDKTKLSFCDP